MKLKEKAQKKLDKFLLKTKEKNVDISRIKKDCLTPEWFQENYTTVEKTKLTLICPIHGEYQQTVSQFLKGKGCRKCSNAENSRKNRKRNGGNNLKPTYYNFLEKLYEIDKKYNKVYIFLLLEEDFDKLYKNQNTKFEFYCEEHGIFEMSWRQLKELRICPSCAIENRRSGFKEFLKNYKKLFRENEFDYSLIIKEWFEQERKKFDGSTFNIKIPIIHKNCNKLFYQTIGNHFYLKQGCPYCDPSRKFELKDIKEIVKKFILESKKLNQNIKLISKINQEWMKNYKGYYRTKIFFKCEKHGKFSKNPGDIKNLKQYGCPICNTEDRQSKGERKIEEILKKFNLKFKKEVKVANTRLRFDFFLEKYNLAFEFDGAQHFHDLDFRGRNLKKIKKNDFLKNKLCHIYKINLIRIPYWDFNNLEEVLLKLLKRERVLN